MLEEKKPSESLKNDRLDVETMAKKRRVTFYVRVPGRRKRKKVSFRAKWKK